MDVTALQPRTDQLAAQLRRAAPAHVQARRAAFTQLLDTGRDRIDPVAASKSRAGDSVSRLRESRTSERPEEFHRPREVDSRADSEPRESALAAASRHEPSENSPRRDGHDGEYEAAQPPRKKPGSVDRPEIRAERAETPGAPAGRDAAVAAASAPGAVPANSEVPAQLVMTPAVPSAGAQPAIPASGAGAAQPAEPAQPANPAGVALAGTPDDSAIPTLVAPLAEPSIAKASTDGGANAATAQTSSDQASGAVVTALATALVGKATARGQNQAMGAGTAPAGDGAAAATQATARAASPDAPEGALPPNRPTGPLPEAAPSSNPGGTSSTDPGAAAGKAPHPALLLFAQEDGPAPIVRITTAPRGNDKGFGKTSAPGGPVAATAAHAQAQPNGAAPTPGGQPSPQQANLAQPAGPQGQPATPAAQPDAPQPAAAVAAARMPADPAPAMFDSGKGSIDPLAQVAGTPAGTGAGSGQNTARAEAARMHRPPMPYAPVAEQVAVRLGKAIAEGADRIDIRLKPAALGSVRISMEVTHDGRVQAVVVADRADTLDMLRQDARSLERALHDAGLKADSNSLSFNLRGGEHRHPEPGNGDGAPRLTPEAGPSTDSADAGAGAAAAYVGRVGLLDIRV